MSYEQQQKQLEYAELQGDVETTKTILRYQNQTQFYNFINQEWLNALVYTAIALARLGHQFLYLTNSQEMNEQTKCNGEMQQKINQEYKAANKEFIKSVAPAIATTNDILSNGYNAIVNSSNPAYEATKDLFRQGVLIKTITPQGKPIMVYIGGLSPDWATGKVSVYQYGAERRFDYNDTIRKNIAGKKINERILQIGMLIGRERAEQEFINPVNPIQQTIYSASIITYKQFIQNLLSSTVPIVSAGASYHYQCDFCKSVASTTSGTIPCFTEVFNLGYYFGYPSSDVFLGLGSPNNPFDDYYRGSPVYVSDENCGSPRIGGFVIDLGNLEEILNDLASKSGKSLNDILPSGGKEYVDSSGAFFLLSPPRSWNYGDIINWAMTYLGYDEKMINSMVNFAIIVGILLSKYTEDIADEIEEYLYDGSSYPCLNYDECYKYLEKVIDDIYNVIQSEAGEKELEALRICRSQAIEVNNSCVNSCFNQVYERLKNLPYYTQWHLGAPDDEGLREAAKAQCEYICSKFNMSKYEECLKNLYPRKGPHIGEI
ncbi:hypothetical protein SJAV_12420 [Sulfurisphaera javensis]|uniref:Uncharacterized protein n=1 Tax=Sulfurisphaera javensis TaxID=2049879 RepID=A0AAT9GR41_9CREN